MSGLGWGRVERVRGGGGAGAGRSNSVGRGPAKALLGSPRLHIPPPLALLPPFCSFMHPTSDRLSTRLSPVSSPLPLFVPFSLFLLGVDLLVSLFSPPLSFQNQGHPGSQQQTRTQKGPGRGSPDSLPTFPLPSALALRASCWGGTLAAVSAASFGGGGAGSWELGAAGVRIPASW